MSDGSGYYGCEYCGERVKVTLTSDGHRACSQCGSDLGPTGVLL